jgi:peptide deformylase
MALLRIRQFGDPVLRERAKEIEEITDVHRRLIDDMIETMREAPGVGLAATQVGVLERLFVWEVEEDHGVLINPVIVDRSNERFTEPEGCLSLPGLTYEVERDYEVTVQALDAEMKPITITGHDLLARVFQHEIDHLDGVLFIDKIAEGERKEALGILRDQVLGL